MIVVGDSVAVLVAASAAASVADFVSAIAVSVTVFNSDVVVDSVVIAVSATASNSDAAVDSVVIAVSVTASNSAIAPPDVAAIVVDSVGRQRFSVSC